MRNYLLLIAQLLGWSLDALFHLVDEVRLKRYPLTGTVKEIGRSRKCDFCMAEDPKVSRKHARLDWNGTTWEVSDLGSTNGIQVNGAKVESAQLQTGDVLTIGRTHFRFLRSETGTLDDDEEKTIL